MQNVFRMRRTYKGPSGNFFVIQNISVNSKPAYDKVFAKIVNGFYPFTIFKKVWSQQYVPCCANQMSGFYMTRITVLKNELKIEYTYFTCDLKVSWFRPVRICWRTCHSGDQHTICRRPNIETKTIYYHIQPSVAFHIEASHLICNAKQMASFYIKCNNELKWVMYIQDTKLSTTLTWRDRFFLKNHAQSVVEKLVQD